MAKANIKNHNGEPAVVINGEAFPPMMATITSDNDEYYKRLNSTGIRIFYITVSMRWNKSRDNTEIKGAIGLDGVEETYYKLEQILTAVPDAYIILRLNVNPNREWINTHPEEQLLYNDGKHHPVLCTSASLTEKCDGMVSFASLKWRDEGAEAIRDYINEVSQNPLFDRVIGYFLCAGGTSEWYYPDDIRLQNDDMELFADFSEPFRVSYGNFLRKKYGTVEKLCRAWNREDATFENPIIPDLEARSHIYKKHKYIAEKFMGYVHLPDLKIDNGIFLDANKDLHALDFFLAQNEATADTIVHFAKVLKEMKPDLLVGAFYGAFGCSDYYGAANVTAVPRILDSGCVDFLATPNVYNNREPGGVAAQREMQDSFRLRNMILISEVDSRTHRTIPNNMQLSMKLYRVEDSITTLKRDFARDICEDIQGWWFDMGGCNNTRDWYDDPQILSLFKEQQEIAKFAYSLDRTKKNEIAIFYDNESVHLVSDYTDKLVLDFFRTSDIHRIGAPVDYYFHEDICHSDMPDYKLYIFANCICLTDKEREAIKNKLRKNGATALFLYGGALMNPDKEIKVSPDNMKDILGFGATAIMDNHSAIFRFRENAHPICRAFDSAEMYGQFMKMRFVNSCTPRLGYPQSTLCPVISPNESDCTVIADFLSTDTPAIAIKETDGYNAVYYGAKYITADMVREFARFAGVHIYDEDGHVFTANKNYLSIHAARSGEVKIELPEPRTAFEVYEERNYCENSDTITFNIKKGETKTFRLK